MFVCAWAGSAAAQNGSNLHVFHNGVDVIYAGIGAGGTTVPGHDGLGVLINGEDLRGNTTTVLGDFGYRQTAFRESLCVLGPPSPSLTLDFPLLVTIEFDGLGVFSPQSIFTFPRCGTAGPFPLGNSAGFVPYGGPSAGTFAIVGFPSASGIPSTTALLVPNHGIVGGPTSATATLLAVAAAELPIGSTGFCWVVQFNWSPSALVSSDDIDSWYTWRANGRGGVYGDQYWGMSNDELGTWQSQSVASTNGLNSITQLLANVSYEYVLLDVNPTTQAALLPASSNGTGTYSAVGAAIPHSGSSINGGFDVGMHQGLSLSGTGGVPNPNTGLANQDPLGSPTAGLVPTLGFLSSNNSPGPDTRYRVTWVSLYFEMTFGLDPAAMDEAVMAFGTARLPNLISTVGGAFPQPLTLTFLPTFLHSMDTSSGALWPGPSGFPGGTFGVNSVQGASPHLPVLGLGSVCIGLPIGLQYGSSALASATGPLVWSHSTSDAPSNSGVLPLLD